MQCAEVIVHAVTVQLFVPLMAQHVKVDRFVGHAMQLQKIHVALALHDGGDRAVHVSSKGTGAAGGSAGGVYLLCYTLNAICTEGQTDTCKNASPAQLNE